jgi:hypothetical protein
METNSNEQLYERSAEPDTVRYIKYKRLKQISHTAQMDDTSMGEDEFEWKLSWKKTCRKTTAVKGKQHHKGLLTASENKRMEKTSRG